MPLHTGTVICPHDFFDTQLDDKFDLSKARIYTSGNQQVESRGDGKHGSVFAMWFGKGTGVGRSGDAIRHANFADNAKSGGVLLLMGDDHTCEGSTTTHQNEYVLIDVLAQSEINDYQPRRLSL